MPCYENRRDTLIRRMWDLHKSELTMKDIGEIFGISPAMVYRILKVNKKVGKIN